MQKFVETERKENLSLALGHSSIVTRILGIHIFFCKLWVNEVKKWRIVEFEMQITLQTLFRFIHFLKTLHCLTRVLPYFLGSISDWIFLNFHGFFDTCHVIRGIKLKIQHLLTNNQHILRPNQTMSNFWYLHL